MRIGFVSTRFAGTDGVTLETAKLAAVAREAGHDVAWYAGELGPEYQPGRQHEDAHFATEENGRLSDMCFGPTTRAEATTRQIHSTAQKLKKTIKRFIEDLEVDVLVPQNALCIPMQLPLGLAITETLIETGIRAVAHHHDFAWERDRFARHAVADILAAAFPPVLPNLRHMVIHTGAQEQLARRKGVPAVVLPNVMDFESGPAKAGDGQKYRQACGVSDDDIVFLQPTRVVPRKGIETALFLAQALADPAIKVIVSHEEGDEGHAYGTYLRQLAERLDVDLRFCPVAGGTTLEDAYAAANLVTYPSKVEGFGNALLEAFFFKRPVVVNRYPVYARDIAPTGTQCVELEEGALSKEAVDTVARWLGDSRSWQNAAEKNFALGEQHFSYRVVRERFLPLLALP